MPEGLSVELKWLDSDEFAHWTDADAFATSLRTARKRREYRIFTDLQHDQWEAHAGLHRIEAPPGTHVIDHVTSHWLPRAQRPLTPPPPASPVAPPASPVAPAVPRRPPDRPSAGPRLP